MAIQEQSLSVRVHHGEHRLRGGGRRGYRAAQGPRVTSVLGRGQGFPFRGARGTGALHASEGGFGLRAVSPGAGATNSRMACG